ncbi:helix-turn-helix domain-containing protein [Ornithinimicrobium avium]|uniref:ArsR family transcriptional regulator n=1 Tax=Ornithinimicrobium avium TaxID=2283195 RepID=A0A345NML4_9MICO|nr:helix-turn-helix domain-containing protein [Ornithinimicrobium avium]AXH96272.1 ArsR family transcriptional regulator [Ornithinimicrobium avium]
MTSSTADLLLHPVRLRVLQLLLAGEELTTSQMAERLPDVPTASLYRHVARLADAGVLRVVRERSVRGTAERTYAVQVEAARVGPDAARSMTRDQHRRAFTTFTASLLGRFESYLEREEIDPARDGISYREAAMWLTDAELEEMVAELRETITARMEHRETPGRTRRTLATVLLPGGTRA